ncbi:MAG: hypothetical protein QOE54_4866 [Streptosporangiaceae bacterium]|jgi:hypothetical protein|nr:hypothetical protein [Streptosporangiaceae bacterium]MDX6432500.1 hypothetical protein [Streptosporangiaceae bacterium]
MVSLGLAPDMTDFAAAYSASRAVPAPVDLGAATTFAVLAGTTVTSTGASVVSPDLGVSPGTAVTGFAPTGSGTVVGTVYAGGPVAAQAQADLTTAYNDLVGRSSTAFVPGDIGGLTITPGVYRSVAASLAITGTLTLDGQGDPNSIFIFQMSSTFGTAAGSQMTLVNGARACNVFFQVGSSVTLGADSTVRGNMLIFTSATLGAGARIFGRVLAQNGAVTMDTNDVATTTCPPGTLSISTPVSRSLGTGSPGTTITSTLGNVTVDDLRSPGLADWTATVSSTAFTASGVPAIPASVVTYTPGAEVSHSGDGTFTAATAGTLSSGGRNAYTHTGGNGSNHLIWNPTLSIAVPRTATATTYTGTVTHSVA